MKILVTGGAGFMGSNMVHHLLETRSDVEVVVLDKLTYCGNLENLRDFEGNSRYRFVKGDIADQKTVDAVVGQGVDVILNYAAETHVDRSILDPTAFLYTEVIGTYNLLEAAKKFGVEKMVQVSTDEVYGSTVDGVFTEETRFDPSSPYSAAKAGADHLCSAYFKTYGTPVVVTHSCNFYGPYQYPEKVIPLFITNLIERKKVPLYGDGSNVREWIFTEDHCSAIESVMNKAASGSVYNIGTEYRVSNLELTQKILTLMGAGTEMIEHVKDRPGHDFRYAVDHGKLTSELGWEPKVSFDEGLRRTVEWYRAHEEWWKPLKSGAYLEYYKQNYASKGHVA